MVPYDFKRGLRAWSCLASSRCTRGQPNKNPALPHSPLSTQRSAEMYEAELPAIACTSYESCTTRPEICLVVNSKRFTSFTFSGQIIRDLLHHFTRASSCCRKKESKRGEPPLFGRKEPMRTVRRAAAENSYPTAQIQ